MTIWVSDNYKQKIADDGEGRREALEIRKMVERRFEEVDVRISMDGRGRLYDNIFVERFWRTIKYEEVYLHDYRTVDEARQKLAGYIHFYNTQRLHEKLGYRTPHEVYFGTSAVPMELRV
jgi:transposase InsO family protein